MRSQGEVGNKAVASVKAKVVTEPQKNPTTEVLADLHGNEQMLKSILPAGWNEKLVFGRRGESTFLTAIELRSERASETARCFLPPWLQP